MPHTLIRPRAIPKALHEVLGTRQSLASLCAILLAPGLLVLLWHDALPAPPDLALWRLGLAWLLILDIAAGSVANFTPGTNQFYASRSRQRWVFIAIHLHLPLVGLLLGQPMPGYWLVWGFTIASASLVNLLPRPAQPLAGGSALCLGAISLPLLPLDAFGQMIGLLFLLKVSYSFAVNHAAIAGDAP